MSSAGGSSTASGRVTSGCWPGRGSSPALGRPCLAAGLPAATGQRWLSPRFQTHLMAAAAGAAGRGVDNSRYYTNKHRSLIELGSGWTLSQGLRRVASPGPGGFSAPVLCSLRELKAGLASSIYARSESAGSPGRPRPGSRCSFRGLEPRQPSALAEGRGIRRSPGESRPAPEGAGPRRSALRRNAGRAGHGRDGILTG